MADGSYTVVSQITGANDVSISGINPENKALNFRTFSNGAQARVSVINGKVNIIGSGLAIKHSDSTLSDGFVSVNLSAF